MISRASFVALRHRNYRLIWIGLLVSITGTMMQNAALLWHVSLLVSPDISFTPTAFTEIAGRNIPTSWRIAIAKLGVAIDCTPLNPNSWMGTSFPYWEGPIRFGGSHSGLGYLEMTGY